MAGVGLGEERWSMDKSEGNGRMSRDMRAVFARAVELRTLHAALMQGSSPAAASLISASASPLSCYASQFSPSEYPVFTPSYEDEPLAGYQQLPPESRNYAERWGEHVSDTGNVHGLKNPLPRMPSMERCVEDDDLVRKDAFPEPNQGNRCKLASESSELNGSNGVKKSSTVTGNGMKLSWLFPELTKKKKNKNETTQVKPQMEESSIDSGTIPIEELKKELEEAKESRDAALTEVAHMKSSLEVLSRKLEYLEAYCEELKKSLRQPVKLKNSQMGENPIHTPKRGKSDGVNAENSMPVSEEVMVEGFLQIVSETRLSVKQFCKILVGQIQETDFGLVQNLNMLLQPYKLSLNSRYSKLVLYHMEAIINQSIYQDFENCVFQINGATKILDPQQDRRAHFQSFVALRNLSWNEVLRKGTKYYSDEFSKFCDDKMGGLIAVLGWTRPWPEQLLQAFFVAAKCIWLLHLLAFSFNPPARILRVDENRPFESQYMEDILAGRQRLSQDPSRVKVMVMPGFYVHDRVLRCKVLCRYKTSQI